MSSPSSVHQITPLKFGLCERCDHRATWQTTFLYRNKDGSERTYSEKVCNKHAKEYANKHELRFPPDAK
jgi:hypothetical protein